MSWLEKGRTALWFARRPDHWAHAAALAARKVRPDRDSPPLRAAATDWARQRAVPLSEAGTRLGYREAIREIREIIGAADYEAAERRAASCGTKMGGAGDTRLLYLCCEVLRATRVIETGVAYGWSSLAILASLSKRPSSRLVSVDMPYPKMGNEQFVGVVVPKEFKGCWTLLRQPDRYGIERAIAIHAGSIDLCHYDSDKSYYGRQWAYPRLWRSLRAHGIFISDDIQDNFAFKDFVESVDVDPIVVECEGKFVGICVKPN